MPNFGGRRLKKCFGVIKRLGRRTLRQYESPSWVGGIINTVLDARGDVSLFIYIFTSATLWETMPELHRFFFNSYIVFLLSVLPLFLLWCLIRYKVILPTRLKFQQYQMQRSERSPLYREVMELKELVKSLMDKKKGQGE